MPTYKTSELEDDLLNLFVAKAEGWTWFRNKRDGVTVHRPDETSFEAGNYQAKYDPQTGQRLPEFSILEGVNAYGDLDWTTDWSKAGPIIERERIATIPPSPAQDQDFEGRRWKAYVRPQWKYGEMVGPYEDGLTLLIAAMRAYVASKLGETVELP